MADERGAAIRTGDQRRIQTLEGRQRQSLESLVHSKSCLVRQPRPGCRFAGPHRPLGPQNAIALTVPGNRCQRDQADAQKHQRCGLRLDARKKPKRRDAGRQADKSCEKHQRIHWNPTTSVLTVHAPTKQQKRQMTVPRNCASSLGFLRRLAVGVLRKAGCPQTFVGRMGDAAASQFWRCALRSRTLR